MAQLRTNNKRKRHRGGEAEHHIISRASIYMTVLLSFMIGHSLCSERLGPFRRRACRILRPSSAMTACLSRAHGRNESQNKKQKHKILRALGAFVLAPRSLWNNKREVSGRHRLATEQECRRFARISDKRRERAQHDWSSRDRPYSRILFFQGREARRCTRPQWDLDPSPGLVPELLSPSTVSEILGQRDIFMTSSGGNRDHFSWTR